MTDAASGPRFSFTAVAAGDLPELAALEAECYRAYRRFAPPGWRPPSREQELAVLARWFAHERCWALLCRDACDRLAGHATFIPAAAHRLHQVPDPSLAHLERLFVAEPHWGSGLAPARLARATAAARERGFGEAARERGFTGMRLYVAAGHRRALRFYEREGFRKAAEPGDIGFGMPSLEYRAALRG